MTYVPEFDMNARTRVVEVGKEWYAQFKEYLHPVERFTDELDGRMGIVLFTLGADLKYYKRLVFVKSNHGPQADH